ncbi:MAG: hypothetical protein WAU02_01535 [Candidatus Saccharimonadales bacterium]
MHNDNVKNVLYIIGLLLFFVPLVAYIAGMAQDDTDILGILCGIAGSLLVLPYAFFGPMRKHGKQLLVSPNGAKTVRRNRQIALAVTVMIFSIGIGCLIGEAIGIVSVALSPDLPAFFQSQLFLVGFCTIMGLFYLANYIVYKRRISSQND